MGGCLYRRFFDDLQSDELSMMNFRLVIDSFKFWPRRSHLTFGGRWSSLVIVNLDVM